MSIVPTLSMLGNGMVERDNLDLFYPIPFSEAGGERGIPQTSQKQDEVNR